MSHRPTKADDLACGRIVALAEALHRVVISPMTQAQRELRAVLDAPSVADDVVVLHVRRDARARDRVGVCQTIERDKRGHATRWEILTPRGRVVWWKNVLVVRLPSGGR